MHVNRFLSSDNILFIFRVAIVLGFYPWKHWSAALERQIYLQWFFATAFFSTPTPFLCQPHFYCLLFLFFVCSSSSFSLTNPPRLFIFSGTTLFLCRAKNPRHFIRKNKSESALHEIKQRYFIVETDNSSINIEPDNKSCGNAQKWNDFLKLHIIQIGSSAYIHNMSWVFYLCEPYIWNNKPHIPPSAR